MPGAVLALEVASDQCERLADILARDGSWEGVRIARDAGGLGRVVTARRRSSQ